MDDRLGTRTVHNRKLGKQNMMRNLVQYFTLQDHDANERRHLLLLKIVLCYEDEDCVTIIVMDVMHTQFQKNRKGLESIVHLAGDDNGDCDLI